MRQNRGFTLVECIVSAALLAAMLTTIWGTLATGQSAFGVSEAFLQANQAARAAFDVIEQDLATSQLYSYYNNGKGNGKVYVKFRRIVTSGTTFLDATTTPPKPVWEGTAGTIDWMRMYVWCRWPIDDPCARIELPITQAHFDPLPGQLLRIHTRSDINPNGDIKGAWVLDGVIAQNLDWAGFDASHVLPFSITSAQTSTGAAVGTADDADLIGCIAPSPGGTPSEKCVNRRMHPTPQEAFSLSTLPITDVKPAHLDVIIRTGTSVVRWGRSGTTTQTIRGTIALRNPQT